MRQGHGQWFFHRLLQLERAQDIEKLLSISIQFQFTYTGDRAIDLWTEHIASRPDDLTAIGERAVLYSRTGHVRPQ